MSSIDGRQHKLMELIHSLCHSVNKIEAKIDGKEFKQIKDKLEDIRKEVTKVSSNSTEPKVETNPNQMRIDCQTNGISREDNYNHILVSNQDLIRRLTQKIIKLEERNETVEDMIREGKEMLRNILDQFPNPPEDSSDDSD